MIRVAILVFIALGLWIMLRQLEQHMLYVPDRQWILTPADVHLPSEAFMVKTQDGLTLSGWFIPGLPGAKTLFLSHGNAGNISHRLDKAARWHQAGFSVCLYDYRGYGHSEGKPSEQGTYQDADAVYSYLVNERHLSPEDIVIVGESLGCAVAVETALHHPAYALILESPFTSTVDMAKRLLPWLPARLIVHYQYDNLSKISAIHMPLLIMHSPDDEIVPFAMGQALFNAANSPKNVFQLKGGHNDGYAQTGPAYVQAISSFLSFEGQYGKPHER